MPLIFDIKTLCDPRRTGYPDNNLLERVSWGNEWDKMNGSVRTNKTNPYRPTLLTGWLSVFALFIAIVHSPQLAARSFDSSARTTIPSAWPSPTATYPTTTTSTTARRSRTTPSAPHISAPSTTAQDITIQESLAGPSPTRWRRSTMGWMRMAIAPGIQWWWWIRMGRSGAIQREIRS